MYRFAIFRNLLRRELMISTANFLMYTQWMAIATIICAILTGVGFALQWGIRFRLVGITGFMGVLVVGLFGLSIVPFSHPPVPGAARFSLVYDNGGNQLVIAVAPDVTETALSATLEQVAEKYASSGRLGGTNGQLVVRARTIIHPEAGVSQPLYLGEIKRSLTKLTPDQTAPDLETQINHKNFQVLQQAIAEAK